MIKGPALTVDTTFVDAAGGGKLAANYTQVGVPLSPGQGTLWTLTFSSSHNDVRQYPESTVADLRGSCKQ